MDENEDTDGYDEANDSAGSLKDFVVDEDEEDQKPIKRKRKRSLRKVCAC